MDDNDNKLIFTTDRVKEGYKLGKILATSAIIADAPLGPLKPKRTKLKLFILALILGYLGFAAYSNRADATFLIDGIGFQILSDGLSARVSGVTSRN